MRQPLLSNARVRRSPRSPIDPSPSSPSLALPFAFIAGVVLALVTAFAVAPAPKVCQALEPQGATHGSP